MEQLTRLGRGQTMVVTPDQRQYHNPSAITTNSGANLGQMVSGEIPTLVLPHAEADRCSPTMSAQGMYPNVVIDPHMSDSVQLNLSGVTKQAFVTAMAGGGGDIATTFRGAAQLVNQPRQPEGNMTDPFLSSASQLFGAGQQPGPQPGTHPTPPQPVAYPQQLAAYQQPQQLIPQPVYGQAGGAQGLAARFNQAAGSSRTAASQPLVGVPHPEVDVSFELPGMASQIPTRYHSVATSEKALVLLFNDQYQGPPPFIPPATQGQATIYVQVPALRTVFEVFVPDLTYNVLHHLHIVLLINAQQPLN